MPLNSFGAILTFAEELETQDREFYVAAAGNPQCGAAGELLGALAKDAEKRVQTIRRIRREQVTEMILEGIEGFSRDPFRVEIGDAAAMNANNVLAAAAEIEERAGRFYREAAEKTRTLSEVSRALKRLAKARANHLNTIQHAPSAQ